MDRAKRLIRNGFKKSFGKSRPIEEIQMECAKLAAEAGFKQYHIKIQQEELQLLNDRIRKLNQEGFVVVQKSKQTKTENTPEVAQ